MSDSTEVIIVGKGISGLVLSLLLKRKGIGHLLLARNQEPKRLALAETLPPSTLKLLDTLNLRELAETHSEKTYGYHSLWGSDRITTSSFFSHKPYQYGLKLKKTALLAALQDQVKEHIVPFDDLVNVDTEALSRTISIRQQGQEKTYRGQLIIDATGRSRAILKRIDVPSLHFDEVVASSCHLPKIKHPELTHPVFTESFQNGWGIVSSLDENTNVMTLFTNRNDPQLRKILDYGSWKEVLKDTRYLKTFLTDTPQTKVQGSQANSSRAESFVGNGWIAVGESAMAYDPLSSHGISNAIYGAFTAAKAIEQALQQDLSAIQEYSGTLAKIFDQYRLHRQQLYASEKRWTDSFWQSNSR